MRPDIAHAIGVLARHSDTAGKQHVEALKRLVKYTFKTRDLCIQYHRSEDPNRLTVFVDADFGGGESRRSTSGLFIMMNGGPLTWFSKVQKMTAQSKTEAEVIAATDCVKDVLYWRGFLKELGYPKECQTPTEILEDNSAVVAYARNLKNRAAAKHYVIRLRFLQEHVRRGNVKFTHTSTHTQVADMFTKALSRTPFLKLRNQVFGMNPLEHFASVNGCGMQDLGGGVAAITTEAALLLTEWIKTSIGTDQEAFLLHAKYIDLALGILLEIGTS